MQCVGPLPAVGVPLLLHSSLEELLDIDLEYKADLRVR